MNKLFYILLTSFLASVFFFACTKSADMEELVRAEKLMDVYPDSALIILKKIEEKIGSSQLSETLSQRQYALWCLLLTQAQHKNYITQTSDSLIRVAVDYFEKRNDKPHQLKAYYYNAIIQHDMGDSPHAQEYYLKALDAGKNSSDHALLGRIYANFGSMYIFQNLAEESKACQEKALAHFSAINDSVNIGMAWRNIGRVYSKSGAFDSAVVYYSKAIPFLSKQNGSSIYSEMADLYGRLEQYPKAFEYIDSAFVSLTDKSNTFTVYINKGDLYRRTGQYDSACYYLFLSLASPNIYTRNSANHSLSYLEKARGDYTAALKYMEKHLQLQDSIDKAERSRDLKRIESLYNYNQIEKERVFHAMQSRQKTIYLNILTISFAFVFILVFLYYQRKKRLYKEQLDKERRIREQKEKQSSSVIKEKEEEIRKLIELSEQKSDNQKEELVIRQQILENEVVHDKQDILLRKQLNKEFKKSGWNSIAGWNRFIQIWHIIWSMQR